MNLAKNYLKNWLLLNKNRQILLCLFFILSFSAKSQIANYVNNGGFEDCLNCNQTSQLLIANYWSSLDTNKFFGFPLTSLPPTGMVPLSSYAYQWPVHGNNYFITDHYFIPVFTTQIITRGYPRNRLKSVLQAGHSYCVKFYCNISNQSTHGISSIGAYFGNSSIDTITKCETPITYLTPQVVNPATNTISDTLNWTLITGTFVANGTEKYMVLGNFKNDNNSGAVLINSANLPAQFCSILYDDVSVIDVDLPAYAGPDIFGIPNNTVYIGRPQDVGIDEACMWYHLPNTTTAIDTAAGITVTVGAITTDTYVVRQEICGNVKWDTVVIYPSGVGIVSSSGVENSIRIYPNPVNDVLNIEFNIEQENNFTTIFIYNALGQLIREEVLRQAQQPDGKKSISIKTDDLNNGIYFLDLKSDNLGTATKKFIVSH